MQTPYLPRPDGLPVAMLPGWCPYAGAGEQGGCRVGVHHLRERKTGPCFPLTVVRCGVHGHAFTLYPPGQVPYGRVAVVPASNTGQLLLRAAEERPTPEHPCRGPIPWESTVFVAALDAAAGRSWPREGQAYSGQEHVARDEPGRWSTQLRWLDLATRLLGIAPSLTELVRQQVATCLSVPGLVLRDASSSYQASSGYQARGRAVVALLDRLHAHRSLPDEVLACGCLAGLWGVPLCWEPGRAGAGGVLRRAFLGAGTPRPDAPCGAGPAATTLGT